MKKPSLLDSESCMDDDVDKQEPAIIIERPSDLVNARRDFMLVKNALEEQAPPSGRFNEPVKVGEDLRKKKKPSVVRKK